MAICHPKLCSLNNDVFYKSQSSEYSNITYADFCGFIQKYADLFGFVLELFYFCSEIDI